MNEDLSGADDPIAQSIQDRLKSGGLTNTIKEADAAKQGIKILKVPAHKVKASTNTPLQDFVGGTASSGLRPPTAKATGAKGGVSPAKSSRPSTASASAKLSGGIKPQKASG